VNVTTSADVPIDRLIAGRYRLREVVGSGGMATVYRAEDESLGRTVALKIFHAGLAHAQDARRQREEVSLLASLNYPGLVTLFDAATDGDDAFLVMEFVDGNDLRHRMAAGPLDSTSTALIGADIASALAYTHAQGVVHRDVKPANILLLSEPGTSNPTRAKLADFGIARIVDSTHLTAAGSFIGTASFLSPEQAEGAQVGAPSDVYSLALTLLECLTGNRAFPGTAIESTVARLSRDPEIPLDLGNAWGDVLSTATRRDPSARPTAMEFARRLRELSVPDATLVLPPAAVPSSDAQPTEQLRRAGTLATRLAQRRTLSGRSRTVGVTAAAVVIVLGAIGLWSVRPGQVADDGSGSSGSIVSYPTVDGDLGAHLEQLQQSVAP
jgi:eukaryotic-like serine/threonine-protein kinase